MKFSVENLLAFWKLSRRARRRGKHRPAGAITITAGSDSGYVYLYGGYWYVVIDGSDSLIEWLKNMLWFRWGKRGEAYGFREPAEKFTAQIMQIVNRSEYPVLLVGFSRGAPIAKSIAIDLVRLYYPVEAVVEFGAPKLGGKRLFRLCEKIGLYVVQIFADGDPVPKLPWIRGKHYFSERLELPNNLRGWIKRHLSYGKLLESGEYRWKKYSR